MAGNQKPERKRMTWPGDPDGEIERRQKKEREEQERAQKNRAEPAPESKGKE